MHNNLNILEMKRGGGGGVRTAALYPKCQRAKYLTVKQFKPSINGNLFPQPTPNCGSSCEKVTGSNVINVLKGGSAPNELKLFC